MSERGGKLREAREEAERKLVEETMRTCSGNIMQAARVLGVSRGTMYLVLKKHGLDRDVVGTDVETGGEPASQS